MARVRLRTYSHYAWPAALGVLYRHNGLTLALAPAASLALFLLLMLPYGKFAHGVYRSAALLKCAIEKHQPNPLQLGSE